MFIGIGLWSIKFILTRRIELIIDALGAFCGTLWNNEELEELIRYGDFHLFDKAMGNVMPCE
jgi:hypothetical protein